MSKIKYLPLCAFLISILFLGCAYASDDLNQTDVMDSPQEKMNLGLTQDNRTFEDIQNEIDNADDGSAIDLNGNFKSSGNEIRINKSITIDGHQNTVLDGKKSSCFFYIDNVAKLSVNGIKFINSKYPGESVGRYLNGHADEYFFTNCVFQDNTGYFLDISSKKATFTDCSFINNEISISMLDSDDLTLRNCNFIKNINQLISRANVIDKCVFQENYALDFDIIDSVKSITNTNFIKNYFMRDNLIINSVNSMYNVRFESNDAGYYLISSAGTVDKCFFSKNNVLIFNKFNTLKNSHFENNKADIASNGGPVSNCKFIGGKGGDIYLKASSITNSYFKNIKNCYIKCGGLVKNTDFVNFNGLLLAGKIDKCIFSSSNLNIKVNSIINSKFTKNVFEDTGIKAKTAKNCQFTKNKGMVLDAKTASNLKFIKNTCKGCLMVVSNTVKNCLFEKNTFAKNYKSAMMGGKILKKCIFKSNSGKFGSLASGINTLESCTFKNNKVTDCGLGMVYYVKKAINSKFINNKLLRGTGGALDDVRTVKKCTFKNNYALAGGAISTIGKFKIEKCTFEKNTVKHSGSAIYLKTPYKTRINGLIKNCKFIKNKSKGTIKAYDVPFKSYHKGTVYALGDFKLKIKITFKKCKGL